jgi:hypothetical protein
LKVFAHSRQAVLTGAANQEKLFKERALLSGEPVEGVFFQSFLFCVALQARVH